MSGPLDDPVRHAIEPANSLKGEVVLPGDKSISHRTAILAALAQGRSVIRNYSASEDCTRTLDCLEQMDVEILRKATSVEILGRGGSGLREPRNVLYAGNSGTSMRLLAGVVAGLPFRSRLLGDDSLNSRPMARIIAPLKQMGGRIQARQDRFPPLDVSGRCLQGIEYELPVASAQVKSCILLAGLLARGETTVVEPTSTRNHTELLIPAFGGRIRKEGTRISVEGGQDLEATEMEVPGDISAASFFLVAASLIPNSQIKLRRVGLNPTRDALLRLLIQHGGRIEISNPDVSGGEPVGDLCVSYSPRLMEGFPTRIGGHQIPLLIDEIPVLAILGSRLKSGFEVTGASELRAKESDRIRAIVHNLRSLGIETEERKDGFQIPPGQTFRGGEVRTWGDHRIAMAFAIAGLISEPPVVLDDARCCGVSFPGFLEQLASVNS